MAKDTTQEDFVLACLNTHGEVSRNHCLRNYITRLSAIMYDLKKNGLQFEVERRDGDYYYKLVKDSLF